MGVQVLGQGSNSGASLDFDRDPGLDPAVRLDLILTHPSCDYDVDFEGKSIGIWDERGPVSDLYPSIQFLAKLNFFVFLGESCLSS